MSVKTTVHVVNPALFFQVTHTDYFMKLAALTEEKTVSKNSSEIKKCKPIYSGSLI